MTEVILITITDACSSEIPSQVTVSD